MPVTRAQRDALATARRQLATEEQAIQTCEAKGLTGDLTTAIRERDHHAALVKRLERSIIRQMNDECRTALGLLCRLIQTDGITALDPAVQSHIREQVELFTDFTPGNDPHGEH